MIIGDLNARIGHWNNAEDDSDFNDNEEVKSRNSRDNYINQFGKILIDFCTTFQCLPLDGNTAGDPDGQYTFVSEQGNSVIDYALVSLDNEGGDNEGGDNHRLLLHGNNPCARN